MSSKLETRLATLAMFSTGEPYFALDGDRWLFSARDGFAIWDLAKGKRLAQHKQDEDAAARSRF